ncbi:hypothetical protein BH09PSE2_BH09PSE2_06150 [soil metagenome]
MPTIAIAEPLRINTIVWIHSLEKAEMGPTRRILDDLLDLGYRGGLPVREFAIANRVELFELLDSLATQAAQGLRPILRFDAHGNSDDGLHLSPANEWASWAELIERLRAINVATENNLVVVFALCCGLHLYKLISLKEATPAYLFAASEGVIDVGFLEDETHAFYKQVHEAGAFLDPFNATLGKKMDLMNCQGLFLKALAAYIETQCRGEVLKARIERSVAAMLKRDGISQPEAELVEKYRQRARAFLEPSEKLIDCFAPNFLIGREPGFTYADVERVARLAPGSA